MSTVRELLEDSLRLLNAIQHGQPANPNDIEIAREAFINLIDSWSADKLSVYSVSPYSFNLVVGKKDYTLGPGADFDLARPLNIEQATITPDAVIVGAATHYGMINTRNGYDNDVGVAGFINGIPPFKAADLYPQDEFGSYELLTTSFANSEMGNSARIGGGIATPNKLKVPPMPVGETRKLTEATNSNHYFSVFWYLAGNEGDAIWVTSANFAYDEPYNLTVTVGPSPDKGATYYLTSSDRDVSATYPQYWTLTRLS
jgi:hypothetical protein